MKQGGSLDTVKLYEICNKNIQINLYMVAFQIWSFKPILVFSICLLLVATARMKYFSINEDSANVHDITEMVRSSFEDQNLILVQSNGCRLEDTEATRGIS